ncbi:uncharacterized protein LOC144646407 isoform X2 [Oculina patagonica]
MFLGILWLCTRITLSNQSNPTDFVGVLTGDDNLTVFADGRLVGYNSGSWRAARWFSFSGTTKTITVSVHNNHQGYGGFLGIFSNGVVTDSSWKCKETNTTENGWQDTNFTDDAWPYAYVRYNNTGSYGVMGIPPYIRWISSANHKASRFICRRRFSTEETASNRTLISILGDTATHIIRLYLDGVFIAEAVDILTILSDQHELQAVQVEDSSVIDVFFLASSSNGGRTNKWWRCTNVYHEGWFLPSYDDSSWPRVFILNNNTKFSYIAQDAMCIGHTTESNKIYCRRNITKAGLQTAASMHTTVPTASIVTTSPQNVTSPSRAPGINSPSSTDASRLSTLVIVVIAVSGGVTAWVIGLAVPCCIWRKRRNKRENNGKGEIELKNPTNDKWEIKSDDVIICEELGHGAFGKVCKGIMKTPSCMTHGSSVHKTSKKIAKSTTITVAVKMLQENATPDQKNDFLDEINLMKAVGSHKNIVSLIGCCIKSSPNFLIVEFASKGDLLSYLRERRKKMKDTNMTYVQVRESPLSTPRSLHQESAGINYEFGINDLGEVNVAFSKADSSTDLRINSAQSLCDEEQGGDDSLTPQDMMSFSWQISQGMQYLSGKGIVHRDLAARNVLVCEKKLVKVADFGLARSTLGENVYHMTGQHIKLPVKWMSPEAINDGLFNTKSDVWSYGVLLWEIATLGGNPYPGIKNRELMRLLRRGYRMEKPDVCSEEFYQLMTRCWADDPDARPTFTELCQDLEDWMQRDSPYLDINQVDEDQPYYDATAVSASSGSSCEEHASESHDLNNSADNLACDDNLIKNEFTSF